MSIESYAVHIAPRGGKIDLIVDEITEARKAAQAKRWEYAKALGAIGLNQSEHGVAGLIFKDGAVLPDGWKRVCSCADGFVAELKATGQKKEQRAAHKARREELSALPALPGADQFTKRIGTDWVLSYAGEGRGLAMLKCWCHRIGETTFVMTPWTTEKDEAGENVHEESPTEKTRKAFSPEGCERVGLSAYYAAKEAFGTAKAA